MSNSRIAKGNAASSEKDNKTFRIRLKDRADDIINIIESLKQPNTYYSQNIFEKVIFCADSRTKREHLQQLLSAIEQYNRINSIHIDTLEIVVENDTFQDEQNIGSLEIFTDLYSPTKYFKFNAISNYSIDTMFQELAAVLHSGTNINQISFCDTRTLFDLGLILGDGFNQFCKYCRDNNKQIMSLQFKYFDVGLADYQKITDLIKNSRGLTDLDINLPYSLYQQDSSIYDAILNANLKKLTLHLASDWLFIDLIKNSQTIEDLTAFLGRGEVIKGEYSRLLREALKITQSLKTFSVPVTTLLLNDQNNFLDENESLIQFNSYYDQEPKTIEKINAFMDRNRKLQNERVRAMIVLLYNIAQSSHCNNSIDSSLPVLPNDIWPLIVTHVKYPGVTLDFGSIAKSIFKDHSIRRVI